MVKLFFRKRKKFFLESITFLLVLTLFVVFASFTMLSLFKSNLLYLDYLAEDRKMISGFEDLELTNSSEQSEKINEIDSVDEKEELDLTFDAPSNLLKFNDLSEGNIHFRAVNALIEKGLFQGTDSGSFFPDQFLTRAQMVVIISRIEELKFELGDNMKGCFSDINNQWMEKEVCFAKSRNWINGLDEQIFDPNGLVTRAQALKFLMLSFDFDLESSVEVNVEDVSSDSWIFPYLSPATEIGLLDDDKKLFQPNDLITRAEFASWVYYLLDLKSWL